MLFYFYNHLIFIKVQIQHNQIIDNIKYRMTSFFLDVSSLQNDIFSSENYDEYYSYELNNYFDYHKNDNYKNMIEINKTFISTQDEDLRNDFNFDVRISFFIFYFMFRKIMQKNFFLIAKRQMKKKHKKKQKQNQLY